MNSSLSMKIWAGNSCPDFFLFRSTPNLVRSSCREQTEDEFNMEKPYFSPKFTQRIRECGCKPINADEYWTRHRCFMQGNLTQKDSKGLEQGKDDCNSLFAANKLQIHHHSQWRCSWRGRESFHFGSPVAGIIMEEQLAVAFLVWHFGFVLGLHHEAGLLPQDFNPVNECSMQLQQFQKCRLRAHKKDNRTMATNAHRNGDTAESNANWRHGKVSCLVYPQSSSTPSLDDSMIWAHLQNSSPKT